MTWKPIHHALFTPALLLTAMTLASGCLEEFPPPSSESGSVSNEEIEQALAAVAASTDEEGREVADEDPAFGDDTFGREFGDDTRGDASDGDLRDELPRERPDVAGVHYIRLLVAWGNVVPDDVRNEPMRWNPKFEVAAGDAIKLSRELRFEDNDYTLPQEVRNRLDVISATDQGVDGVILQIAITRPDAVDAMLAVNSPISVRFDARELLNLDRLIMMTDRSGNGMMFVSLNETPEESPCAHGFLGGHWVSTGEGMGVFGGEWTTEDGGIRGHIAGNYAAGHFRGKLIGRDGRFEGLLAGEYGGGAYRGSAFTEDGRELAAFYGHYANTNEGGHGQFRGAWHSICDRAPSVCDETVHDRPTTDGRPDGTDPSAEPPSDERPSSDERPDDERDTDQ